MNYGFWCWFEIHHQQINMIWFTRPFNRSVSTNVAKTFLQLKKKHIPRSHKIHKIHNHNTVSCSCLNDMLKIIKWHNKKATSKPSEQTQWNGREWKNHICSHKCLFQQKRYFDKTARVSNETPNLNTILKYLEEILLVNMKNWK